MEHAARIEELLESIRREEHGLIGALLVDKPAGITSHDAVQRVRRALGTRSVGHTGTLDPFATGLLVVLVGRATRLARFVEPQPKTYLATARLGPRTDTDDRTGSVIEESPVDGLSRERVLEALAGFVGEQRQRPPAYSAKHVGGERSYRLARRGEAAEPPEATVTVHRIEPVGWASPALTFRATVSAGTYLRAIARDLGARLGVGAHLTALRREAIGGLRVEDAIPLDQVTRDALLPPAQVLRHLPAVELDAEAKAAVVHGRAVADIGVEGGRSGGAVVLLEGSELVAVAQAEDGWLKPTVVLGQPGDRDALAERHRGHRRLVRRRAPRAPGGAGGDRRAGRGGGARQRAGHLRAASARGGEPAGRAAAAHHRCRSGARSWRRRRSTSRTSSGSTGTWPR